MSLASYIYIYINSHPYMELLSFLLCSLLFLLINHCFASTRRRNLPPGPYGLPIFGNLFDIGPNPHESLAKLAKKYGSLVTIRRGSLTTIVASSAEMAKEILQKQEDAFSGRLIPDAISKLDHLAYSLFWSSSRDQWRLTRRVLHTFLTSTQKVDSLRELRHKVVQEMVEHVKEVSKLGGDEVVDISKLAFTTTVNQMSNTCFSENVAEFQSKDANGYKTAVKTIMEIISKFNVADYFPSLKGIDPQGMRPKAKLAFGCLEGLCDKFINQRVRHREFNLARHGDLLDSFLDFSQENESDFNLKHILALLVELFLAGTDTSTNTTEWALTELIRHPDVMIKLRKEITQSVREKGRIEEAEVLRLPYLQAVVKETMRLHLTVSLLAPRKTEKDVKLNGYWIPKNTQVLVNIWAIARDAELWDKPTCFMPERFLNNELDFKGQHFSFLPFSSGRRMCSGIALAQRVVSLMIASLVYHFEWKLPNGMKPEEQDMNQILKFSLQRAQPLLAVPNDLATCRADPAP